MDDLHESPTGFHIELGHFDIQDGITTVAYTLGADNPRRTVTLCAQEARTIAAWFAGLATELEASEEVSLAST